MTTPSQKAISTYSSMPVKDITLEDMAEAMKLLKPMPRQKLVMCKKHFKLLSQRLPKYESHANPMYPSILGELGGIPIEIRPYLKKVRLYEEVL